MIPTPRHQVLTFAQSVLLLVGMAVIGWVVVAAIAGREAAVGRCQTKPALAGQGGFVALPDGQS